MTDRNMYGPEILIGVMINYQFTTDDKKDKYAKSTTDVKGLSSFTDVTAFTSCRQI